MTISALKNGIEMSDKVNTIQIYPLKSEIFEKAPFIITKSSDELNTPIYKISGAGEYEISDIMVHGYKIQDSMGKDADLFRITIEGIDVLYVTANIHSIPNNIVEEIGNISVIIFELDAQILPEKKMEIAKEFDVYYSVINGNNPGLKLFDKLITEDSELKKLKLKEDEFNSVDETASIKFVCLK